MTGRVVGRGRLVEAGRKFLAGRECLVEAGRGFLVGRGCLVEARRGGCAGRHWSCVLTGRVVAVGREAGGAGASVHVAVGNTPAHTIAASDGVNYSLVHNCRVRWCHL